MNTNDEIERMANELQVEPHICQPKLITGTPDGGVMKCIICGERWLESYNEEGSGV